MSAPELAVPFPAPPRRVRQALEQLRQVDEVGLPPAALLLERPWEPGGCSAQLRAELWPWLDDVVSWLNHGYAWQTASAIPSCWPTHPHLVHELAVLACLRVAAAEATAPHALEEWHRYALPGFTARMSERLGIGCAPGRHLDWPARSWTAEYHSPRAAEARRALFEADIGPIPPATTEGPRPGRGFDGEAMT